MIFNDWEPPYFKGYYKNGFHAYEKVIEKYFIYANGLKF
jgi:hypothetical protein